MVSHLDRPLKIAVTGDIHDQWSSADNEALEALNIDLALFVGDFGNEAVGVVRQIARLPIPTAVILGNHDAWYTASSWGRKQCPYDRSIEDRVREQLELLGESHVGYGKLDLPDLQLSIVGGRPFSWGGSEWKNRDFYKERYNVSNFEESIEKILENVRETAHDTLIFLGHNGPLGLGDEPESICGRDWQPLGGDHGDPDLAVAIQRSRALGKRVSLVTFGHMHHRLRHTSARLRTRLVTADGGTVYLNAASVPRVVSSPAGNARNFSLVTLYRGSVTSADLVWIDDNREIIERETLYHPSETVLEAV
ncbi:TIGR04168 family protein [Pannus brasiliensis CCIBt3594]|uniref:TIGR04168 family protein n=2 Tax=Bacillati TaxID=1783272 RepID=A0AAW9QPZ6_9CHRO